MKSFHFSTAMLPVLRRHAQSPIIQGVVIIIAIVFIFWGVGANLMQKGGQSALTVGDEQIGFEEYQRAYERLHEDVAARFGGNLSKEMADNLHLKEQVIDQLVQAALLRQGAKEIGLEISGKEVQDAITAMPQFQDGGKFSLEKYNALLAANRLTPNTFESGLRHDLLREKATREIGRFVSSASDQEVDDLFQYNNQRVVLSLLRFRPAAYRDQIKVDDKSLAAWYEGEKNAFKTPPEIKVRYLAYRFADTDQTITISDERIRQYYDEHADEFTHPEMRRPRILFLKADATNLPAKMQEAEALRARALAGEDFETLVRRYSEHPSKTTGGDVGLLPKAGSGSPIEDMLFSLQPGDIGPAVSVQDGVFLMQLVEIQAARQEAFDQVKEDIAGQLRQKEAESLAFKRANDAYEGIIGAGSIEAYLQKNPQEHLQTTDFFRQDQPSPGLAHDPELLAKIFALNGGELSSLLKASEGYFVVFADEKKAPVVPDLAAVRPQAEQRYVEAKAKEMATEKAKEALAALRGGKSMTEVAKTFGLGVEQPPAVSRREWPQEWPPEMMKTVFALSNKSPYPVTPAVIDDDHLVYVFRERQKADVAGHEAELSQLRQSLLQFKRERLLQAFLDQERLGTKIHQNPNL